MQLKEYINKSHEKISACQKECRISAAECFKFTEDLREEGINNCYNPIVAPYLLILIDLSDVSEMRHF